MQKNKKISKSDYIASVAGSVNFDNISGASRLRVSIGDFVDSGEFDVEGGELSDVELEKLFKDIYSVIDSPSRSKMSPEHSEDLRYILDGLQVQITRSSQSNKYILHRFLYFLGDRYPEISKLVSDALTQAS